MKYDLCLSVCVPAFNEEKTLSATVEDLVGVCGAVCGLDIIIVDDGSRDATGSIADGLAGRYAGVVRVVHQPENRGVGAAYRAALTSARGDYFTWFPGDHENSAGEFVAAMEFLAPDRAVTCHHHGKLDTRPLSRRLLSRTYTFLLNLALGRNLSYYNGLTVFPIAVLRARPMVSRGFFFPAEGVINAMRQGCRIKEMGFPLGQRSEGRSKAVSLKSLCVLAVDFFKVVIGGRG